MRRKANYKGLRLESNADDLELLGRWSDRACFREQIAKIKRFTEPNDALVVLCRHSLKPFKRSGDKEKDEADAFRLLAEWLRQVPELPKRARIGRRSMECWWLPIDLEPRTLSNSPIHERAEWHVRDRVGVAVETALMLSPKGGPAFVSDWISRYQNGFIVALRYIASGGDEEDFWLDELLAQGLPSRLAIPRFIVDLRPQEIERIARTDPDYFVLLLRYGILQLRPNRLTTDFERLAEELEANGSIPDFAAAHQLFDSDDRERNPLSVRQTVLALDFLELIQKRLVDFLRGREAELEVLVQMLLPHAARL